MSSLVGWIVGPIWNAQSGPYEAFLGDDRAGCLGCEVGEQTDSSMSKPLSEGRDGRFSGVSSLVTSSSRKAYLFELCLEPYVSCPVVELLTSALGWGPFTCHSPVAYTGLFFAFCGTSSQRARVIDSPSRR